MGVLCPALYLLPALMSVNVRRSARWRHSGPSCLFLSCSRKFFQPLPAARLPSCVLISRYLFQRRPVSRCLGKHYANSLPRDVNAPIGDLGSTCLGCSGRFQGGELTRGGGLPPGRAGRSSTERSVISPPRRSSFSVSRGGVTSFLSLLRAKEAMLLATDC